MESGQGLFTHILVLSKQHKILRQLQPDEPGHQVTFDLGVKDADDVTSIMQLLLVAGAILEKRNNE